MPPAAEEMVSCSQCCLPASVPRGGRALSCAHAALWCAASTTLALLLGGAGTIAVGWRVYPPRGAIVSLALPEFAGSEAGDAQRLLAWCAGPPPNASAPTIFLDFGGGGHSSSDAWGLQRLLNAAGRRVCVWDPPGTGWSPRGPAFVADDALGAAPGVSGGRLVSALLAALGPAEPGPFVLVGSMDGGAERIYDAALRRPDLVRALVPMQFGVPEFAPRAAYLHLSDAQTKAFVVAALAPRLAFCDVIRFLGVQWGLIPLFTPHSPTYEPAELEQEKLFLNTRHEGQWDMQCRFLAAQVRDPARVLRASLWTTNRSLAAGIPVLALDNPAPDLCPGGDAGPAPGSDDCAIALLGAAMNSAFMASMANLTAGSRFLQCAGGAAVCADWLGEGSNIHWVRDSLLAFLASVGA